MKLVLAIIQDKDSNHLASVFVKKNIRATKLATSGGFLREGNTTFIIGIENDRVEEVLDLIKENCQTREQFVTSPVSFDMPIDSFSNAPIEVQLGGATVFVMPIEGFYHF